MKQKLFLRGLRGTWSQEATDSPAGGRKGGGGWAATGSAFYVLCVSRPANSLERVRNLFTWELDSRPTLNL